MDWMNVLKTQQVNIGSTTLDTRELPDEEDEDDCLRRLIALKNKIDNYEFNLKMPPWFPKIIDWQEGWYVPNKMYTMDGGEKWNEALLPELYKINPEWKEIINPSGWDEDDNLIDIHTYSTSMLKPEGIPEPVACQILKIIDNPKHTGKWMTLFTGEDWDRYGEWEYFMRYSPNSENEDYYNFKGHGKRVTLWVKNGDKNHWFEWELTFEIVLDNHPDAPYPMNESNKKLILNYDEIDVDWTKW